MRRFCSPACKARRAERSLVVAKCKTCGCDYRPRYGKAAGYCSMACRRFPERRLWPTSRDAKCDKDYRRRCRKRGAGYERFARKEIFERDGWRCGICGEMTDRTREASRDMRPSLDHVIPLAKGGAHSRANVQCAHWICNSRKGAQLTAG